MKTLCIPARLCALSLFLSLLMAPRLLLKAAAIQGTVTDPASAPIAGARIAAIGRVGVLAESVTNAAGHFEIALPDQPGLSLTFSADGFATRTLDPAGVSTVQLSIASRGDSIRVTGSAIDVPASESGTSLSIVTGQEIRSRNEAQAVDLLRYLPGIFVSQSGQRGSVGSIAIRGGDTKYNLVEINGVPVNSFYYGGYFDFSQIPTGFLSSIEVARGPQSAIYGSYANSGVVNFITRSPEDGPRFDVVAEGGSHGERLFSLSGSGVLAGFGIAGSVSRMDFDGPVPNSDYTNQNVYLNLTKKWGRQNVSASGNYDANDTGEPGPYGSDPARRFTGLDTVSRSRNYFSDYAVHYQADVTNRLRQEVFTSFFLNNSPYVSPYGFSYSKDIRGQAEERTTFNIAKYWTMAAGFVYAREEVKNTYITDFSNRQYPLRRDEQGIYWDNQLRFGKHLFVNAGVREEVFEQPLIPATPYQPALAARNYQKTNPKVSGAYLLGSARFHSSFGTGIRPPGGSDLAFTNNPDLKPERSVSVDAGVEQRFWSDRISVDATYFYNRYNDLIVSLGGNLAVLSSFQTANLARARSGGAEFSAHFRPARWLSLNGNYTYLDTSVLSLEGSGTLVQKYYSIGQQLLRRPAHSGAFVSTFTYRRATANVLGYFRGSALDVEPNYGVSGGFYRNGGYQNIGVNLNYDAGHGLTLYGNVRNLLNQRYEEIFGFPAPLLNFVSGVKWSLPGRAK